VVALAKHCCVSANALAVLSKQRWRNYVHKVPGIEGTTRNCILRLGLNLPHIRDNQIGYIPLSKKLFRLLHMFRYQSSQRGKQTASASEIEHPTAQLLEPNMERPVTGDK
jgi:hypothetical protein